MKRSIKILLLTGSAFLVLSVLGFVVIGGLLLFELVAPPYPRADCDILVYHVDPLPGHAIAPRATNIIQVIYRRLDPDADKTFHVVESASGDIEVWVPKALHGKPIADPVRINTLLKSPGWLEFRIAPCVDDSAALGPIDQFRQDAVESLNIKGPAVPFRHFRWFEMQRAHHNSARKYFITGEWNGVTYILLHGSPDYILTQSPTSWKIERTKVAVDSKGLDAVFFKFDASGTHLFSRFTARHVHAPMIILMDDVAIDAPRIPSQILDGGVEICFGYPTPGRSAEAIRNETETVDVILSSGPLPARLTPISTPP